MPPPAQKPLRLEQIETFVRRYLAEKTASAEETGSPAAIEANATPPLTLREVLSHGWLEFYCQPKMDLRGRQIVGAEMLARCRHPLHGVMAPESFLPNADEESMLELSTNALAAALSGWEKLAQEGFPVELAINITVNHLVKLPIPAIVREHRPTSENWPGLILEVTEDEAMRDMALMQEIATEFREFGISLALDDFDSGYSDLVPLRELPFAELKLDRSLVMNCERDSDGAARCRAAIDLAHEFGAEAVAEGVEKRSEFQALATMGCDIGQGFLVGPPMPRETFIVLLKALAGRG